MTSQPGTASCPRCGATVPESGEWTFCPACGSPLAGATCLRCEASLTPGARYCHRCGMPAGGQAAQGPVEPVRTQRDYVPWTVGGIAVLALLGMLVFRGLTVEPSPAAGEFSSMAPVRAADISQLSPEERADRLYNRVMLLAAQDKRDSVAFFAPMAIEAYRMLGPLNDDQHYDVGRVAEVAGALPLARAHADSILARSPNHLLGLALAARIADLEGNTSARAGYERRLLAAEANELRRGLSEYERHADEISAAVAAARQRAR